MLARQPHFHSHSHFGTFNRAEREAKIEEAAKLVAKLRELGVDPDAV